MGDWTLGKFLIYLAASIVVPAAIAYLLFQRKGGHRLFEKDGLSSEEVRRLPIEMLRKRTARGLKGTAAAVVAIAVAMALYRLGCLAGLPIEASGVSDEKLFLYVAGAVVLAVVLAPAIYRKLFGG